MSQPDSCNRQDRIVVTYLDESELLTVLRWQQDPVGSCITIRHREVPENATVERVFYDPMRRGFAVMLRHSSFDCVPIGAEPPILMGALLTIRQMPNVG